MGIIFSILDNFKMKYVKFYNFRFLKLIIFTMFALNIFFLKIKLTKMNLNLYLLKGKFEA
jgi:hypothetical protein